MGRVDPLESLTLVCGVTGSKKVCAQLGPRILSWQQPPAPLKKINVTCFKNHEKGLFILVSGSFTDLHKYTKRSEGSGTEKGRRTGLPEGTQKQRHSGIGPYGWVACPKPCRGVRAEGMNWEALERLKHYT